MNLTKQLLISDAVGMWEVIWALRGNWGIKRGVINERRHVDETP